MGVGVQCGTHVPTVREDGGRMMVFSVCVSLLLMEQLVVSLPGFFRPTTSSGFFSSWKNLRKKPGLARTSETALERNQMNEAPSTPFSICFLGCERRRR